MNIPYGKQSINAEDILAVTEVLTSDWLTIGPKVSEFEKAIALLTNTSDAVAVSSGTAALHTAYAALGIESGHEVITTPLTFVATAATAMIQGAKIVFADIQSDTGNIDPSAVEHAFTPKTRVVSGVDYAGHPIDAVELRKITAGTDAVVLEDAAHSIGSLYRGEAVGNIADVTTFSFFPTKNMTSGEGGAVVSRSTAILDRSRLFRSHGMVREPSQLRHGDIGPWHQEVHSLGINYRLPDILCALGISQLSRLDVFKAKRTAIFERYAAGFAGMTDVILPTKREYVDPMWHLYPLRVPASRRRKVFEHLRSNGVLVQVNYLPVYWHPFFEDAGYLRGQCPVAEEYYSQEISLPMYSDLTVSQQDRVIELVRQILS